MDCIGFKDILIKSSFCFDLTLLNTFILKINDIKKIDKIFCFIKNRPIFFTINAISIRKKFKIEFNWEKYRLYSLGISSLSNLNISDISINILKEIAKNRKKGILQHKLSKIFAFQPNDVHHYLINLLKFKLVRKYNCILELSSKSSNAIQLKSNFSFKFKKLNFRKKKIEDNTLLFLLTKLVKFAIRITKIIKQKKIKHGILSFFKHSNKNYKRKFHRTWYKIKEKCNRTDIFKILPKLKIVFEPATNDYRLISKPISIIYKKKKKNHMILGCFFWHFTSLFFYPPEIQIRRMIIINKNQYYTSPLFLHIFRGFLSYKTIQFTLKNLEKLRGVTEILHQIGRQKIIHFYYDDFISDKKNPINFNKKINKRITEQVLRRRIALLNWSKENFLQIKELGKKFADFENKGLKKIDSKVVRRVLSELISLGYLKVIKIYTQSFIQKPKVFEFIVPRNRVNFLLYKLLYFSISTSKNKRISDFFRNKNYIEDNVYLKKIDGSFLDVSFYFLSSKKNIFIEKKNYKFLKKIQNLKNNYLKKINFTKNFTKKDFPIITNRYFCSYLYYKFPIIIANVIHRNHNRKCFYISDNVLLKNYFYIEYFNLIIKNNQLVLKSKTKKKNSFNKKKKIVFLKNLNKKIKNKKFFYDILVDEHKIKKIIKSLIIINKKKFPKRNYTIFFLKNKKKNFEFILNKKSKIYKIKDLNNFKKIDIAKCKWDCEIDTIIYSHFLFSLEKLINNKNSFDFLHKRLYKRRIKGLSFISNVKIATFFFKKSTQRVRSNHLISSVSYFYQVIKRSLELPKDTFFLNLLKIKTFLHQFPQIKFQKKRYKNKKRTIFNLIKNFYFKNYHLFFLKFFSIRLLFFVGIIIFLDKKPKNCYKIPLSNFDYNKFQLFEITRKKILCLQLFYNKKLPKFKNNQKFYTHLNIGKNSLVKKQVFINNINKDKIILTTFFIKNKIIIKKKKRYLNNKTTFRISNKIQIRIFFHKTIYIHAEKIKNFIKRNYNLTQFGNETNFFFYRIR